MAYWCSKSQPKACSIWFSQFQLCASLLVLKAVLREQLDRGRQCIPSPVLEWFECSEATAQEVLLEWGQLVGAMVVVKGLVRGCPGLQELAVVDMAEILVAFCQRFQDLRSERSCSSSERRQVARFLLGVLLVAFCQETIALGVDHALNLVVDPSEEEEVKSEK